MALFAKRIRRGIVPVPKDGLVRCEVQRVLNAEDPKLVGVTLRRGTALTPVRSAGCIGRQRPHRRW
jgi:hypothetical protein